MNATSSNDAAQARAALEQAQSTTLTTNRDRRVHGLATAGFGLLMGAFVAINGMASQRWWVSGILAGVYVPALLALTAWQNRGAHSLPRHARTIGRAALTAAAILALASIIWLNVRQGDNRTAGLHDQIDAWWVYVIAAIAPALPMLIAGHLIAHDRRR